MLLRASLTKLLGSPLSRWTGAAALIGLFSVSAGGCGGCDDASLICDSAGKNCEICDGYGCHPADPNGNEGGGLGTGGHAAGSGGAGSSCDQTKTACPCTATQQCDKGLSCINSLCVDGCQWSYECGPGNVCINSACAPGCDAQTPCQAGYTCTKGACVVDPKNPQCSAQMPCPGGYICAGGLCTTTCSVNTDCSPGQICDSQAHNCVVDPSPKPVCSNMVKCTGVGQVCLADGYCHYPCGTVDDCKKVDSRFIACDTGVCKTDEEVKPQCTASIPCPVGQACVSGKCL
jgi:hypothetical protein